jgi:hypothetical protein
MELYEVILNIWKFILVYTSSLNDFNNFLQLFAPMSCLPSDWIVCVCVYTHTHKTYWLTVSCKVTLTLTLTLVQVVKLLISRRCSVSILTGTPNILTEVYMAFLSHSRSVLGYHLVLYYGCSRPYFFQFVINCHPVIWCYITFSLWQCH